MPEVDMKLIGGSDYVQASGLIARGYSKLVLSPQDVQGGIVDIINALGVLGLSLKNGPLIADADAAAQVQAAGQPPTTP